MDLSYNSLELGQVLLSFLLMGSALIIFSIIGKYLRLPSYFSDILAGLFLGPTFLIYFYPDTKNLFSFPPVTHALSLISELGFLFLMYEVGFYFRPQLLVKEKRLLFSIIIGTLAGAVFGTMILTHWMPEIFPSPIFHSLSQDMLAIFIFLNLAIISVPVLGKIFSDHQLHLSRFAHMSIASALGLDLILFIILGMFLQLPSQSEIFNLGHLHTFSPLEVVTHLLLPPFLLGTLFWSGKYFYKLFFKNWGHPLWALEILILILINAIGPSLNVPKFIAAIGAGLFGQSLFYHKIRPAYKNEGENLIKPLDFFGKNYFISFYFLMSAFQMNLHLGFSILVIMVFLGFGLLFRFIPFFALFPNEKKASVLDYSIILSARGGPGIIVAILAYQAQFITPLFFNSLLVISLLSSLIAAWWVKAAKNRLLEF